MSPPLLSYQSDGDMNADFARTASCNGCTLFCEGALLMGTAPSKFKPCMILKLQSLFVVLSRQLLHEGFCDENVFADRSPPPATHIRILTCIQRTQYE